MTICDKLILMYRGLYLYSHVLLKGRGEFPPDEARARTQVREFLEPCLQLSTRPAAQAPTALETSRE